MKIGKYTSHTPFWVEFISDSLLIISQGVVGYGIMSHNDTLAWIAMITGTLSKVLARFIDKKHEQERLDDSSISSDSANTGS